MRSAKSEVIEKLYCIVGNDGDASARETGGGTVSRTVESNDADSEAVVRLFVRVTGVTGPGRPLKAKQRLTVLRSVVAPGERAAISKS
jgi:hypothetical protein